MSFHEERFPTAISLASSGGPERRTDIVVLGSGHEERNARWAASRRRYDAGYGIKTLDELHAVITFFEERRGPLYGFRWRDPADCKSCAPLETPTPLDQVLATGDGITSEFQLIKQYGGAYLPYNRDITKPVAGTVRLAVDGIERTDGIDFTVDTATGLVTFAPASIPPAQASVTAGFEFDVPVRFDTDRLEVNVMGFKHGSIPSIPIVEVRR